MASNGSADDRVELDARELSEIVWVPQWLRGAGQMSWLLVGLGALLVGIIWLLSLTYVIVLPVLTAGIVAAVASPLVAWMQGRRIPRALGTALLMLAIIAIAVGMTLVVVGGIVGEAASAKSSLSDAQDKIVGWLEDLGIGSGAAEERERPCQLGDDRQRQRAASRRCRRTQRPVLARLLPRDDRTEPVLPAQGRPDDPRLDRAAPRGAADVAKTISRRVLGSLRGYFLGTTIVAAFNAAVVAIGAWILGVPLIGTIVAVTFIGAYIPYIGAWAAGAFAVLMALGGAGPDAAAGMIVLQLLANSILQQFVQPFAMGAALGLHPLAVLIVTIAGGALFGTIGLILAAPLTSAVVRISADLARHGRRRRPQPASRTQGKRRQHRGAVDVHRPFHKRGDERIVVLGGGKFPSRFPPARRVFYLASAPKSPSARDNSPRRGDAPNATGRSTAWP